MFEDAIRYPWQGDEKVTTLLLGGVLGLLGFLLIPAILVLGYLVRVVRQVEAGDRERPPTFEDWGDLLIDGLVATLVAIVYTLVPTAAVVLLAVSVLFPFTVVQEGGAAMAQTGPSLLGLLALLVAAGLTLLVVVASLYLLPAAVAAYAVTGRLGAAFSPGTLRRIGGSGAYPVAWLVAVAIGILAQLVGGALAATVVGALLLPVVSFYGNVAGAYAIGRGVSDLDLSRRGTTGQ
ncbi:DUF4013 domain-containing protein [Haloarcula litorea]|uniref:DUF4013 domain-containing protein n=1 Tax=Haloarcula litorea TaxID=3032579 RepID=UPI0023E817E0|nr:DUF4013 domain-containing protein [Halomicroarcula sp. GDY20]